MGGDKNLVELGQLLRADGYTFTTITPASHKIVLSRTDSGSTMRDFFGWNKWVKLSDIPERSIGLLKEVSLIDIDGARAKSKVRFSTIDDFLILHSEFPTHQEDSVFFGPDSYRFVRFLKESVREARKIIDVGAGSGVGGMCLARHLFKATGKQPSLVLCDINDIALRICEINLAINQISNVEVVKSDILKSCPHDADLIIANPPFIIDELGRTYRDGGKNYGAELSAKIVEQSLSYLKGRGQLVVYTGASIVAGEDQFHKAVKPLLRERAHKYFEIDPDIFGEQLRAHAYADVERIAAVGLTVLPAVSGS